MPNDARQADWTVDPARKTYALALGEDADRVVIGGEADASKFAAELHFERWAGAASLGLRLPGVASADSLVDTADKRVRIEPDADSEFQFWPVGRDEMHFGWLFKRQPKQTRWTFELPGHEQFDFHYQPALTPDEIEQGSIRPEPVVGSWAVYHRAFTGNRYRTGKAWHIYRPRFVDALGNATWADVQIDRGEYVLELPAKWLDNATYPVRANDTFGLTSKGGTAYNQASLWAAKAVLPEDGTIETLHCYYYNSAGATTSHGKASIYDDDSGPGDLLATEVEVSIAPGFDGWKTFDIADYSAAAGTYWLAEIADSTFYATTYYDSGSGTQREFKAQTYANAFPDPFGAASTSSLIFSIYATYSVPAPPNYFAAYQPPPSFLGPPPPLTGLPY